MATPVDLPVDKGALAYLVGGAVGLVGIIFGWLQHNRHAKVDESALVLSKWKEFAEIHQSDMKQLKGEFVEYKSQAIEEIAILRKRLNEVEAAFAKYRLEAAEHIATRDLEIAGLKRAIAQNSQSTAYQLGQTNTRSARNRRDIEGLSSADDAARAAIAEHMEKLDRIGDNSEPKDDK